MGGRRRRTDLADWFAPKRFGYGAGLPISWQGWLLTLGFMAVAIGSAILFATRLLILFGILIPATIAFLLIARRTTRGGWRWRSGGTE